MGIPVTLEAAVGICSAPPCDPLASWPTSNASTTMRASVEAVFFRPVTSTVKLCLPAARPVALKTIACICSVVENVSTSSRSIPSSDMRAIPVWGPRPPIQLTDVPVKVKVACACAVPENLAVPPLHGLLPSWAQTPA